MDEVADRIGCGETTVYRWLRNHDIERRPRSQARYPEIQDERQLREWHFDNGMTLSEIADEVGCSRSAVSQRFEKFGIKIDKEQTARRRREELREGPPQFALDHYGYETVRSRFRGETDRFKLHRLIAVAEWGTDAVEGAVVHHKKNIPWLNYADNLELMERSEHSRHHHGRGGSDE